MLLPRLIAMGALLLPPRRSLWAGSAVEEGGAKCCTGSLEGLKFSSWPPYRDLSREVSLGRDTSPLDKASYFCGEKSRLVTLLSVEGAESCPVGNPRSLEP